MLGDSPVIRIVCTKGCLYGFRDFKNVVGNSSIGIHSVTFLKRPFLGYGFQNFKMNTGREGFWVRHL